MEFNGKGLFLTIVYFTILMGEKSSFQGKENTEVHYLKTH